MLVGEHAASGAIRVTVAGATTTAAQAFEVRPQPDVRDSASAGPPIFYHGPQHGTPAVGRQNQRVLAIFASAAFETPIDMATEIGHEMATFTEAERFWREASYERTGSSPHGTSFKIEAGPAITLPRRRNAYVWDESDTAFARWQYLSLAKRWTQIVGSRAFCAHQGGGLAVADVSGPNWPTEVARLAPGWLALHVVVQGNTAFIAAGADGLIVADVAGPTPVQLAKITLGGNLRACDVSGNTLVAAARDSGLEVYDVSNRAAPVRRAIFDGGAEWASAIRLQGTRAYMGSGDKLRIYDVSNPRIPVRLGEAPAGDWILALDVVGNTCVVGTDGNGLAIFDVSGPVPLPRGSLKKDALRIQGVRLVGTTAYVACGAQGLMVVDVSDPSKPVQVALVPTGSSCYDVAVSSGLAVVAFGASAVGPCDMSNPKVPSLGFLNYVTSTPPLGGDYDLAALQTNLKNADDSNGKLKDHGLYRDGLLGAKAALPALNLNDFEGFIIVIRGFPGRGQSTLSNKLALHDVGLSGDKGVIWLPSHTSNGVRTTWGRKAHEIGHWLGMDDIYEEKFEDATILEGTAEKWDMAGAHDEGPLFSGREAMRMKLFSGDNVAQRTWNPAGGRAPKPSTS